MRANRRVAHRGRVLQRLFDGRRAAHAQAAARVSPQIGAPAGVHQDVRRAGRALRLVHDGGRRPHRGAVPRRTAVERVGHRAGVRGGRRRRARIRGADRAAHRGGARASGGGAQPARDDRLSGRGEFPAVPDGRSRTAGQARRARRAHPGLLELPRPRRGILPQPRSKQGTRPRGLQPRWTRYRRKADGKVHHGAGHLLKRGQEPAVRGALPHLQTGRLYRRAVQGTEHGAQLIHHRGRQGDGAARRSCRPRPRALRPTCA